MLQQGYVFTTDCVAQAQCRLSLAQPLLTKTTATLAGDCPETTLEIYPHPARQAFLYALRYGCPDKLNYHTQYYANSGELLQNCAEQPAPTDEIANICPIEQYVNPFATGEHSFKTLLVSYSINANPLIYLETNTGQALDVSQHFSAKDKLLGWISVTEFLFLRASEAVTGNLLVYNANIGTVVPFPTAYQNICVPMSPFSPNRRYLTFHSGQPNCSGGETIVMDLQTKEIMLSVVGDVLDGFGAFWSADSQIYSLQNVVGLPNSKAFQYYQLIDGKFIFNQTPYATPISENHILIAQLSQTELLFEKGNNNSQFLIFNILTGQMEQRTIPTQRSKMPIMFWNPQHTEFMVAYPLVNLQVWEFWNVSKGTRTQVQLPDLENGEVVNVMPISQPAP